MNSQPFWIYKGTSNFCSDLQYDIETEMFTKCRPEGFYDIVSAKDTIQGGIKVISYEVYEQVKHKLDIAIKALEFECGNRCAHQNPCNAREALEKIGDA